jgi:hypothetical protein
MREHFGRIVGTTPLAYRLAFRSQTATQMRAKAKTGLSRRSNEIHGSGQTI